MSVIRRLLVIVCLLGSVSLSAQTGHWEGSVQTPEGAVPIEVDLTRVDGELTGTFASPSRNLRGVPLSKVVADGASIAFAIGADTFRATLAGQSMKGTFVMRSTEMPFELTRTGEAKIEAPAKSAAVGKELEGSWSGTLDVNGEPRKVGLRVVNHPDGTSTGVVIAGEGTEVPVSAIAQDGAKVTVDVKRIGGTWSGTLADGQLSGTWTQGPFNGPLQFRRSTPVDRWAEAAGGRDKVAAIKTIYREGTLKLGGYEGSIKVWRTADGKYRKEEQVASYSSVETFDGTSGRIQRGGQPARALAGDKLAVAVSKSFANSNAVFYVFFPERRRGTLATEGSDTVVFQPAGGVEWRVTLDPRTSLPKTMTHREGDRTIKVSLVSYETVDGIRLENEIHRTNGDPRFDAVIRFTKTVINGPIDPALFAAN